LNLEKISTVKLSEKFRKIKNQNFHVESDPGAPGADQGGHQWPRRPAGAACPLAAPTGRLGPTGIISRYVFFLSLFLSPKTRVLQLELAFLLFLVANFDLYLQPIICVEILSKYSLVCDSSTPPIRFLIGGFICEYLVVLGAVHMSLHSCLEFYF